MSGEFDLAVVGSGFAGSLLATIARRLGLRVALIERGRHPRFAIGEASSPLANRILEDLAARYDLEAVRPLAAWGSWRRAYPNLDCGLKRGFTFFAHRAGARFAGRPGRANELLVAASPRDEVADTHWLRADLDRFLADEAQRAGVDFFDETRLEGFERSSGNSVISGDRHGRTLILQARLVVDASGPRGFLHRALALPEDPFPNYPPTEALYTHFEGVRRLEELPEFACAESPPYPPDDAAVHHVFDGGWIWVLRFRSGLVSAGIAARRELAQSLLLSEGESAWNRVLDRFPSIGTSFEGARPVRPFVHLPRLPFRSPAAHGPGWLMLPSAAAFVDPLLSTGIPLTLLGVERLATILERRPSDLDLDAALAASARLTLFEAACAARLVAALYAALPDFETFSALTMLYFAAASYAEAARRLGSPERSGSFLSADRADFGPALRSCCDRVLSSARRGALAAERATTIDDVRRTIGPLDVAGWFDPGRRNWHPVEAAPLLAGAGKLDATRAEIAAMLRRSGFFPRSERRETRRGSSPKASAGVARNRDAF